jgi:hypothetical protein
MTYLPLFFDGNGIGTAFGGGLLHYPFKMLRDDIEFYDGQKLVFIILENLRAEFIAISVTHALLGNDSFHVVSPFVVDRLN